MSIPEGLRDVIGKRLSRLSPDCNRLLAIAAVIGRDFGLDDAAGGCRRWTRRQLVAALEEAAAGRRAGGAGAAGQRSATASRTPSSARRCTRS